jgi:tetratricopeptide (TPR) repeat protein
MFAPPDAVDAAFDKGSAALAAQDYSTAEQQFKIVLKALPGDVPTLGNLGVVYSRTNRYAQAIDVYQRALKLAPGNVGLTTNLGLAYVKQEQYQLALPIFESLVRIDGRNLQARELLASCQLSTGRYESALANLKLLTEAAPDEPGVLYMLGVTLTRLKRKDEAHAAFARMMSQVQPAQADFLMGKANYDTQRFEEAADSFRKAASEDPALPGVHRELGKALISLHDDAAAEKELRAAAAEDAEAIYYLGGLLSQSRPAEAVPLLEKARKLTPDFWGPLYYLGRIYADEGRTSEALPLLERAAKLNPDESAVQYQLGRVLQKAGRAADARAAFARVQELKNKALDNEVNTVSPGSMK